MTCWLSPWHTVGTPNFPGTRRCRCRLLLFLSCSCETGQANKRYAWACVWARLFPQSGRYRCSGRPFLGDRRCNICALDLVLVSDHPRCGNRRWKWPKIRTLTNSRINGYDLVRITPTPILLRRRPVYFSRAFSARSLVLNLG